MEIAGAATSFIRRVKSKPNMFCQFRRVMRLYSSEKLDVHGVMSELDVLFQSHHSLLTRYRIFLPPEFRATSPSLQQPRQSRQNNAIDIDMLNLCIDFMNKVQKRFGDERGVIQAYLETVGALKKGQLSNRDACNAIAKIFGNENQDLVDAFKLVLLGDNNGGRRRTKKKKTEEEGKRMEEEMYEVDVQFSRLRTTVEYAKALRDSAAEEQHQNINIDNYFSAVSLGCIRKEYKEQGSFVIQQLRENPRHVLPQILEKLESREKKLAEAREKVHEYWRGVQDKKKNSVKISSM